MKLIDWLFGCSHKHTTFPITPVRRVRGLLATSNKGTYVVCLDCGKEFDYNWNKMKLAAPKVQLHEIKCYAKD